MEGDSDHGGLGALRVFVLRTPPGVALRRRKADPGPVPEALPTSLLLCLGLFVFVGFATQAMAGFGGTVISLTLGAILAPIERLVPIIVAVGWVQTLILALRLRREVNWRLLLTLLLPGMCLGAVGGQVASRFVSGPALKLIYGVFVVAVAGRELAAARSAQAAPSAAPPAPPLSGGLALLGTVGAGVIHGIYASGGPLLVYVVGRLGFAKAAFRATLITVWLPLNTALLVVFVAEGRLGRVDAPAVLGLLIPVGLALVCGNWAHHKVDEGRFRTVANVILLIAGGVLLATTSARALAPAAASPAGSAPVSSAPSGLRDAPSGLRDAPSPPR